MAFLKGWGSYGVSKGCLRDFHGGSLEFLWDFKGMSMGFPLDFNQMSMGSLWYSMIFRLVFLVGFP